MREKSGNTYMSNMTQACQVRLRISVSSGGRVVCPASVCRPRPWPTRQARPTEFQHRLGKGVLCRNKVMSNSDWTTPTLCMSIKSKPTKALDRLKKVSIAAALSLGPRSEK